MPESDPDSAAADSTSARPLGTGDIGAVARRAAAAERANRAVRTSAERADAARDATADAGVRAGDSAELDDDRGPGVLIGLALGAAAVAIVLARTVRRRR